MNLVLCLSQGRPVASFDPEGLIFAVGVQSEQIKLYDVRSFDKVGELATSLISLAAKTATISDANFSGTLFHVQISHRNRVRLDRNQIQLGWKDDDAHHKWGCYQVICD